MAAKAEPQRMPDALSKTVPIWCAVLNRANSKRRRAIDEDWDEALYVPGNVVSASEKAQIEGHLDTWASALKVGRHLVTC